MSAFSTTTALNTSIQEFTMPARRSITLLTALVLSALAFVGCAAIQPGPKTIRLDQAQLLQLIGKQFPLNQKLFEVLEVALGSPKLKFDTQANRIVTALDVSVSPTGLGQALSQRSVSGGMELSYALKLEPTDNSVRMTDVKVSKLELTGLPSGVQRYADQLGPRLAEQLLNNFSVYKFKPEDLKAAEGWGYKPAGIRVVGDAVVMTLEPLKR
jgi:hypothetical protein